MGVIAAYPAGKRVPHSIGLALITVFPAGSTFMHNESVDLEHKNAFLAFGPIQ